MDRAKENFLTISWVKTLSTGVQIEGGYKEIRTVADITHVVKKLADLPYTPVDLRVYEMKHGSLQPPTFQQERGVPDNLQKILEQKLNEILAMPGVAVGITATMGISLSTDATAQLSLLNLQPESNIS